MKNKLSRSYKLISIALILVSSLVIISSVVNAAKVDADLTIFNVESVTTDTTPPASITNLYEYSIGTNWIEWIWVNPNDTNFSHVMIYLDGMFVTNTSDEYYNFTNLSKETVYTLSTKTVDTSGNINSTWVNDSVTTLDQLYPIILNVSSKDVTSTSITLFWEASADTTKVEVLRNVIVIGEANGTTSYADNNLASGTTYTYMLVPINKDGVTGHTVIINVTTSTIAEDLTPPASVTNLKETIVNSDQIRWTWLNPTDADFSHVIVYLDGVFVTNTSEGFYNSTGLSKRTTYAISTKTVDASGNINQTWINDSATTSSSSSGGGSSSKKSSSAGGGGAGSAEDFSNIKVKESGSVYLRMNVNTTYEFSRPGNDIKSVNFYSLKNSGQTTYTIEILNNRSKLVNSTPEGFIYKYVNIWVGNAGFATPANIKDARIKFKVNTSWIQQMEVSPADVRLQRYNGIAWNVLPTMIVSNSTDSVVFESQTPGFSPFAITAEKALPISSNGNVQSSNETKVSIASITQTEDNQKGRTTNMWIIIIVVVIFLIGVFVVGYEHLKRR